MKYTIRTYSNGKWDYICKGGYPSNNPDYKSISENELLERMESLDNVVSCCIWDDSILVTLDLQQNTEQFEEKIRAIFGDYPDPCGSVVEDWYINL